MTPLLDRLSEREEAVLLLLAEGFGQREVASRLGITAWTVKAHVASGRRKLGASSTTHAVAIVIRSRAGA